MNIKPNRKTQLYIALFAAAAMSAGAQTIQPLYTFSGVNNSPLAPLTLGPDGNFYGTTFGGGFTSIPSTVFRVTTNGALTTLVSFNNTNGSGPSSALLLGPDGNLYGTTSSGGNYGSGTAFRMTTTGTLTTLVSFNRTNEANPQAGLTLGPDGNFYGTTEYGSSNYISSGGCGAVYRITSNGTLTSLYFFTPTIYTSSINQYTNSDGANPLAGLTLGPDGNFYGTTPVGGAFGNGTVFKITTNGTFTPLHSFTVTKGDTRGDYTNYDGSTPSSTLTFGPGGYMYGTANQGGLFGCGTVFRMTTNGVLTTLVNFNGTNGQVSAGSLLAAANCYLVMGADGNFYGTTQYGGAGSGTVFRMTTYGVFTSLASFTTNGSAPNGLTLGPDGTFYGTAGVKIYRLNAPTSSPPAIIPSALSYSHGTLSFNCSTTTNFSSRVYATTNPAPPITWLPIYTNLNGGSWQFSDTNAGASGMKLYRLSTP